MGTIPRVIEGVVTHALRRIVDGRGEVMRIDEARRRYMLDQ